MGKIYDISESGENKDQEIVNDFIDIFTSITDLYEPRSDVKFRDSEIKRIDGIMNKSDNRAVLLIGDKGSGKQSIIEGYAHMLSKWNRDEHIFTINYDELCESVSGPGDFVKFVDAIMAVGSSNSNVIININNFGHLLNHNVYGNGGFSFLNKTVKAISEGGMRVIATDTNDGYNSVKNEFQHILDFFTVIKLTELTVDQTKEIINDKIGEYENIFDLKLPDVVSELVCENANKYIKDHPFPEKGIWFMDEVCSNIRLHKIDSEKLDRLTQKLNGLKLELIQAMESNDYKTCEKLNKDIKRTDRDIDKLKRSVGTLDVQETDILSTIGDIVGVKMSKLDKNQTSYFKNMSIEIKKNVIGQDETVDKIVKNITRNKLGLRKSAHSMGNFIFIGSTGVGKTHLAKQIANYLYGSEDCLLRFDMSEYQSEIDVSKLLGSAPGYVGYKESGQLVKRLAKYPESVVLFDEIEKAHPKIYDVLLQLLDEGFVTGSDGNKVDATKSLIIFTSNIGIRAAREYNTPLGFSNNPDELKDKKREEIIRKALDKRFSPEFLNRLDGICYFNNLDRETLKKILYREIGEMNVNIKNICGKTISLDNEVENWILNKVESEENGARPIIRHLQQNIEEELATMIVDDDEVLKKKGNTLTAHIKDDKIVLK